MLGVSESTVRRLVKAGKLEAERILRPQGYVWMVMVPAPSGETLPGSHQVATAAGTHPPAMDALATWTRTVLEPLISELGLSRQTIERQAEQIAGLREERGRLHAELDHLRAGIAPHSPREGAQEGQQAAQARDPDLEVSAPPRREDGGNPRSRTRWPWDNPLWLLLTGLLLIALVTTALWLDMVTTALWLD